MDWDQAYQNKEHFVKNSPSQALETFLTYLTLGQRVLDVGCGNGTNMAFLREHGILAEGVDISAQAIKGVPGAVQGDAEHLPYPDGSFDAAYSFNTYQFTILERSIPELARVLKPRGLAYLIIITHTNGRPALTGLERLARHFTIVDEKERTIIDEKGTPHEHTHTLKRYVLRKPDSL